MAPINQPADLLSQVQDLRRQLDELRRTVGLSSATINRGGLSLLNDAFLKMINGSGVQVLYFGPDESGRQIIRIRRDGGSDVLWTGFTGNGNQFWRLTDRFGNRELFSDDTENGGIARPWLSVPMVPRFSMAASSVWGYMNLDAAALASETVLWVGRIPLVAHSYLNITGVWGRASGTPDTTYRVRLNGTQVGSWAVTGNAIEDLRGPWLISSFLDQSNVKVEVTAVATGAGAVACEVQGVGLRQTP
ncbi:hypothetical protein [Actinokineospora sp.]|uniref:hypothetical protein n=1 Tax=Actinokineospora sp. TaxID=1872133 RepID=UPI003D6BC6ED